MFDLIIFLVLLVGAYFIGSFVEKSHYSEIIQKERAFMRLPAITSKKIVDEDVIENSQLVTGSVVISLDHFKRFLAGLRNFFGGRISSYETLLDRGRREAILRMKAQADAIGSDLILNMRFETSSIGQVSSRGTLGCFEVLAYGTAVKLKPKIA